MLALFSHIAPALHEGAQEGEKASKIWQRRQEYAFLKSKRVRKGKVEDHRIFYIDGPESPVHS